MHLTMGCRLFPTGCPVNEAGTAGKNRRLEIPRAFSWAISIRHPRAFATRIEIRQNTPTRVGRMPAPHIRRSQSMSKPVRAVVWLVVAMAGALAVATIALHRGEEINAMLLVVAAVCSYALGYRFYSKFIAARVLALDAMRATPAERLENGRDFVRTNKWVVFGHHFAAIAGPGPLVGPVLAAQFGYLPGTLWILAGAVFGGAGQDFVNLFASMRRNGKSLGQMAREEIGKIGGFTALVTVLLIMIILLAVVGLVVVNALKGSPWGTFTIAATMPIAVFMGLYLR